MCGTSGERSPTLFLYLCQISFISLLVCLGEVGTIHYMQKEIKLDEFIQKHLIDEIGLIVNTEGCAYSAFFLICIGIEFIGRCLSKDNWNETKDSFKYTSAALEELETLKKYKKLGYDTVNKKDKRYNLYKHVRCGLIHQFRPDMFIVTDSVNDFSKKPQELGIKDFYKDFVAACKEIIDDIQRQGGKVKKPFGPYTNEDNEGGSTGSTQTQN